MIKKNINSNKNYALEVINYTKKFGKFVAVQDVNFGVTHGKIHGFIGPNGAGKTTTIKAIIGAYSKSSGQIMIEGFKAGSIKAKKRIGYIPERASFPGYMTCMEYLVAMAQLSGFKSRAAKAKALEILKDLGLEEHTHRKPALFSSGMKKKILVAQALMTDPTVLVLDEPAANLDPTARKDMFEMFTKITNKGYSILISSHILSELQFIVDEVTFISQGQIRFSGGIKDLASKPGLLISFIDSDNPKSKNFIKKYKFQDTTSGWKLETKTTTQANEIAKKVIQSGVPIASISFLASNLSSAYDELVIAHGRESGVDKKKKTFLSKFKKEKSIIEFNGTSKVSNKNVKTKIKKGGKK